MQFTDDTYEVVANIETDLLLVDMPLDLIKEQIRHQINNPLGVTTNYIESMVNFIEELLEAKADDEEALSSVHSFVADFFGYVINEINARFEVSVDTDQFQPNDYMVVGTALYNFLILRYKKNVSKFIQRFILKNKKLLVENFDGHVKKKDVTTIAVKKKIKNKDDILILSSLPKVVKYIMSLEIDALDFLKYASNDENYDANIIRDLIHSGNIIGNFTGPYLGLIVSDYDTVLDEIQVEVKMKLMKKL